MCSARRPSSSDLTAQAKIRNAAIALFARDGFQKTNLRAIAAAAGVSAALVIHHFGSKEGLRGVCDEYVLRNLVQHTHDARPEGMQDLLREYLADPEEYVLHVQYMARAMEEDSPAATTFVDTLVAEAEAVLRAGVADGTMHPFKDIRAMAVWQVAMSVALLTMAPPLTRSLGYESFGPEVLHRLVTPMLELTTRGLYTNDTPLKAAEAAWEASQQKRGE
ncbi:TetR family transcriptional regulator [Streptosporangium sp. NPDC002607]